MWLTARIMANGAFLSADRSRLLTLANDEASRRQYHIWRLIDELLGSEQMDEYFKRAKLNIVDVYWPGPKD